jgi:hypothetical protein
MKAIVLTLGILFALRVDAGMVRVVDVQDAHTLVVEHDGIRETVRLAGIVVMDEARATDLLRWNVVSTWVMLERRPCGGVLAFRSPDALFVNRELVLRGYARATEHGIEPERNLVVTYLGTIDPPAKASVTSSRPSQTNSGTRRRSSAARSPKSRDDGRRAATAGRSTAARRR